MHIIRHFITITRHRNQVIRHCFKCGIGWQGLGHDLSKYSPAEFFPGARFWTGTKSPQEGERREYGYSPAWLHHKGRNRHHFEYWTDYDPVTRKVSPVKMPARFVAEMFCDRVAASKIYQGKNYTDRHPLLYFEKAKANRFIHPETSDELERLLRILAEEGEEKAFAAVREYVKAAKKTK